MALNPKRIRFCEIYVGCLNASQAAREAGYSKKNPTVTSARIMAVPEVQEYIAKLQEEVAKRNEVTVDRVIEQLFIDHMDAKAANQHGPAIRATELIGKSVGMFKDNVVLTELQGTSDDDLIEKVAKGDAKKAAALRELLVPPDTFDAPETRH